MDLCIKTSSYIYPKFGWRVSILVLMDLCIKTESNVFDIPYEESFNPCFNGSMYKNCIRLIRGNSAKRVSILVLMDLCIKTKSLRKILLLCNYVSILVLMDLCIKTHPVEEYPPPHSSFNPCFNGSMYKNFEETKQAILDCWKFQSLF